MIRYNFDPSRMYQPQPPQIEYFDEDGLRFKCDGTVENLNTDWGLDKTSFKGWNVYEHAGGTFRAYRRIADHLWPDYPKELNCVDHINRCRHLDAFSNLRRVNTSLNNINQYRPGVKGYRHETKEWLQKVNGYRANNNQSPIVLDHPLRNQYIAIITYKGKPYELGAFDHPEDATKCYLEGKETFIQDRLREIWTDFMATAQPVAGYQPYDTGVFGAH